MKPLIPAVVLSAALLAAGCSSAPRPDRYCPGVTAALPHAPPATLGDAPDMITTLTQAEPPGNDKPLDRLILSLDQAVAAAGRGQGILGGSATAGEIARFYSALAAVRAYCKARS